MPLTFKFPVIVAVSLTFKFLGVNAPSTFKFCSITRLLLGNLITPVPFALSSKSLLVSVVLIMLSSICIFSNWNAPLTLNVLTFKLFAVMLPVAIRLARVVVPATLMFPVTAKLLPGTVTSPVPDVPSSKSLLVSVVLIVLF